MSRSEHDAISQRLAKNIVKAQSKFEACRKRFEQRRKSMDEEFEIIHGLLRKSNRIPR